MNALALAVLFVGQPTTLAIHHLEGRIVRVDKNPNSGFPCQGYAVNPPPVVVDGWALLDHPWQSFDALTPAKGRYTMPWLTDPNNSHPTLRAEHKRGDIGRGDDWWRGIESVAIWEDRTNSTILDDLTGYYRNPDLKHGCGFHFVYDPELSYYVEAPIGDVNLDGSFTSSDLVLMFQAGEYEDSHPENSSWREGDVNVDAEFNSDDLVLMFSQGTYELEPAISADDLQLMASYGFGGAKPAVNVPEPFTSLFCLFVGALFSGLACFKRRPKDDTDRARSLKLDRVDDRIRDRTCSTVFTAAVLPKEEASP